ncbi:MAG: tRNA epoxyqueuosine(34) reductase QueG [Chthoniobacteraceae bacterium]
MKAELIAFAESLGFDLCRIAPVGTPAHAREFRAWLAEGRHGKMGWLARNADRRTDPELVLMGARSIIVLAMNYFQTAPPAADVAGPRRGRIARYAWGDDYHEVIGEKLGQIDAWLTQRGGRQRQYVDTGPVLERDAAAEAGLGWQGKSTMVIHPKLGTFFFLAEVLTTLEFAPDTRMPDHCGKCTRCLTACPTDAITAPHQLDARRCISYLTIENKGPIPEEFRAALGDRIYGCDDCLDACPWNRFAREARESTFAARDFVTGWSLRDFLGLDDAGFRALFRDSPIKRIKRRGFLRNVCVALGNIGTREDLAALRKAATDQEPLIVEHAVWAIAQIEART